MFKKFFRVLSRSRVVIHDGKPIKKCDSLLSYPGATHVRFTLVKVAGYVTFVLKIVFTRVQGSCATCYLTDFSKTLLV